MSTTPTHSFIAGTLVLATVLVGVVARVGNQTSAAAASGSSVRVAAPSSGPITFTGTLDRTAVLLGKDGLAHIELVMAAAADKEVRQARRPTDMVVILDRSGSMSGDKIEHARAAVRELVGQLSAQDRFALVTYANDASIVIPLSAVDDAQRIRWLDTVNAIQPEGGTNMSDGLDLGLHLIEGSRTSGRVPHVLLISDGLANQGDATPEGLTSRARRAAQGEYMLSSVGVGTDFNEYLMTALADAGTGNYYYVHDPRELAGIFAREFGAARTTVASGLAVQIEPGAGVRVIDAAGYPLEATANGVVLRPGSLFAGQERRIWVTLAMPQHAVGEYEVGRFSLAYGEPPDRHVLTLSNVPRIACVADPDQFYANVDVDAWSRSVVVEDYNKMQEEVAREVKAGRRDRAVRRLQQFKDEAAAMNDHLDSAAVTDQLDEATRLWIGVDQAFEGPNQEARQQELSKATSAQAVDSRRIGAKK
jgi:Ca-activated chloride channel family protein